MTQQGRGPRRLGGTSSAPTTASGSSTTRSPTTTPDATPRSPRPIPPSTSPATPRNRRLYPISEAAERFNHPESFGQVTRRACPLIHLDPYLGAAYARQRLHLRAGP